MQYKLRDSIVSQVKISYAKDDGGHHQQPAIDCSAGSNPFSMPDAAKKAIAQATVSQVNLYPHHSGLKGPSAGPLALPSACLNKMFC